MFVTVNREKHVWGTERAGWSYMPCYIIVFQRSKVIFNTCIIPIIFVSVMYIRLSDLRKTKNMDGALEKNVDYQFEFPRQYII